MASFILVHGSFHGAWNWHKVVPLIEQAGHAVSCIDMPGHGIDHSAVHQVSLQDCVQCLIKQIDRMEPPIILVAHSRNGIVISQAAEYRANKIAKLVYLAAYLVPDGKSMMDFAKLDEASLVYQNIIPRTSAAQIETVRKLYRKPITRLLLHLFSKKTQRTHLLDPKAYRDALYHDCPPEIVALAQALLTPEPNFPGFTQLQLSAAKYGSIPRTYIECLQDHAVTLKLQRLMQAESPCDKVYQLDSGHSPFFSMPARLTDILLAEVSKAVSMS